MRKTLVVLLTLFLATQVATITISQLITVPSEDPAEPREPRVDYLEGGESIEDSIYLYFFLMGGVVVIAVAMRFKLGKMLFRNLELLIVFLAAMLLLLTIFPERPIVWLGPPLALAAARRFISHWMFSSLLSIFLAAAVGAIMGVSLGTLPIIALMAFLSVYDIAAVKFSTHMRNVVTHIRGTNSSFLIEIPGLKSAVGVSDFAVPAMLVTSVMILHSAGLALIVAGAGAMGLGLAIVWSSRSGMVPALPFIFATSAGAYGLVAAL